MDKIKELITKLRGIISKDGDEAADKRVRINKAQQQMMLAVAGASIVFGICLVLSIHFVQYMVFYSKVLAEENKSIESYEKSLIASGACYDTNNDKRLSDGEIEGCNPGQASLTQTYGSLRYNIMMNTGENKDLESVARDDVRDCYENGDADKPIDYVSRYERSMTDEDREKNLAMVKICSSLRVIPDALPAQMNQEALMASLNQVFDRVKWSPESLVPGDVVALDEGDTLGQMPVTLTVEGQLSDTLNVLHGVEKSIRAFNPTRATISWSNSGLSMQANATAYYNNSTGLTEQTKVVNASSRR